MEKKKRRLLKPPYTERQLRWLEFASRAWMHVQISGGPIHAPHEEVLQLRVSPWQGNYESWTIYRHSSNPKKPGKLVIKTWDFDAQKKRFSKLKLKTQRDVWNLDMQINERQFPLPALWVGKLERTIERLSVPPITGPVKPLSRATEFRLRFWRSEQQSEFRWHGSAPPGWNRLSKLFESLLQIFRDHGHGKSLAVLSKN